MSEDQQAMEKMCPRCCLVKNLNTATFRRNRDGWAHCCISCSDKRARARVQRNLARKGKASESTEPDSEHGGSVDEGHGEDDISESKVCNELGNLSVDEFFRTIASVQNNLFVTAFINLNELNGGDLKERMDQFAHRIFETLGYRCM
ncbi:hypothetical protein CPC08DRAFT_722434 [Agrocybe pediades]|nr:hypothetical protein CPC08DRAFT_722434 [Agrocybe pediades]